MWLISCAAIIYILYFILILIFESGWKRTPNFKLKETHPESVSLSVIIACKNEASNLPQLISALSNQTYKEFELIIVNDHSTDNSSKLLKSLLVDLKNSKVLNAIGFGKKNAIKEGMTLSTGEFIVTCDADCIPDSKWLETIVQFQSTNLCDLIICPVKYVGNNSLFYNLQNIEFTSLVASGAGAAGFGMPILCNGANLAFKKSAWLKSQAFLHVEEQSGDDIFLLESIKRNGGKIQFLKSEAAFVKTKAAVNVVDFIKQRRRWAGKSTAYTDWQLIYTACVVMIISFLNVILIGMSFINLNYLFGYIVLFLFKFSLDIHFLYIFRRFFQLSNNLWIYAFLLSIIYPFYIVFVALSSFLIKKKKWK